jgi:hypothetical protein
MAVFLCDSGCEFQEKGDKRIYHLSNNTIVTEHIRYPGKTRFRFYTRCGQSVYKPADKTAMKQAVERFKKYRRIV